MDACVAFGRDGEIDDCEARVALALLEELSGALRPLAAKSDGARILQLPNELLLQVLQLLPSPALAVTASVCRLFGGSSACYRPKGLVEQTLRLLDAACRLV